MTETKIKIIMKEEKKEMIKNLELLLYLDINYEKNKCY